MKKLLAVLVALILAVVVVGTIVLSVWDIPAPSAPMTQVFPDDRFPR